MANSTSFVDLSTNVLQNETSPYLLQHAGNPVHWQSWTPSTLEQARREDKPLFLSIGYSACHWCHVMAHESFEDQEAADLVNEHFVPIKVDREEHPAVDMVYQLAVQVMRRQGGWPLSVFALPSGEPFWAATYLPPAPKHGLPSFSQVVSQLAEAFQHQRQQLEEQASQLTRAMQRLNQLEPASEKAGGDLLRRAAAELAEAYDEVHGGLGSAPKFPNTPALEVWLNDYRLNRSDHSLAMATHSLEAMAQGGLFDQVGGGFHRYSTDEQWLVPHFEKMLYDNGLLARLYLRAHELTGRQDLLAPCTATLDYLLRETQAENGAFYASQDADTEGQEGRYYTWTPSEFDEALGPELARKAAAVFGVTAKGNFEHGLSVLHTAGSGPLTAEEQQEVRDRLRRYREKHRQRPGVDHKIISAWNGLVIRALAGAGRALDHSGYLRAANRAAATVLEMHFDGQQLARSLRGGAPVPGCLADYAQLTLGLLALYEAGEKEYLQLASQLMNTAWEQFHDAASGSLFYAPPGEALFMRPRDDTDSSLPAATSSAAEALALLARYDTHGPWQERAERVIKVSGNRPAEHAWGMASLVNAWVTLQEAEQ